MRFCEKRVPLRNSFYRGVKGSFVLEYRYTNNDKYWYVSVRHKTKDIRYNSLWEGIHFDTEEEVQKWCETFDHKKHQCLGDDR